MSKRHPKRCKQTGKVKFQKEGRAKEAATRDNVQWARDIQVYQCPYCNKWHRTSQA